MKLINWVKNNPSKVLTGGIIAGTVLTGIFSFKAGIKAERVINRHKNDIVDPEDTEYRKEVGLDILTTVGPDAGLVILALIVTIICTVKNYKLTANQITTLLALGSISSKQLSDINAELVETYGEKKAKELRGKAMVRRFNNEYPNNGIQYTYIQDCGGDVFCGDAYSNIYWMGSHERLNRAIEELAYDCVSMTKVSLNDLYLKIGLEYCPIAESVVWTLRDISYVEDNFGNRIPKLPIDTTTFVAKWNDRPCLGLIYSVNCG